MHRQKRLFKLGESWWRFDRYEIKDNVIQPAADSVCTLYDPWADFQKVRNQTHGQPAYSELARLATTLQAEVATKCGVRGFSPESEAKILDWCARYGLLGVLLSRWESVTLSPRPVGQDSRRSRQERYLRGYGTTVGVYETDGTGIRPRSSVVIHPLNDLTMEEQELGRTWFRFFPSVPWHERETFPYPVPYSKPFREVYAEPVMEFWRGARLFAGIVEHLGPARMGVPGRGSASKKSKLLARRQAIESLNLLRKNVSQMLIDEGPKLRQEWVSPSLLASFAEMFVIDTVAGRQAQYCQCCGFPFISDAYQARYCSRGCRLRQQKRNLRDRQKRAHALHVKGHSVRAISRSLRIAHEIVQGWVAGLKRKPKSNLPSPKRLR
jgi:hypothetical protein